jgi:hypothetical protein
VVDAISLAQAQADQAVPEHPPVEMSAEHVITRGSPTLDAPAAFAKPYVKTRLPFAAGRQLHEADNDKLAKMIKAVATVESPVHVDEVTRRLMDAFGVGRAGSRITTRIGEALHYSAKQRVIDLRGGFVYAIGGNPISVRDRSSFSPAERKIELVAPEEVDGALLESVRLGFSLAPDEAIASAMNLLGFGRVTQKIAGVVEDRLVQLSKVGMLVKSNGALTLPP